MTLIINGIDAVIEYLKPERISFEDFGEVGKAYCVDLGRLGHEFFINKNDDFEEQVKAILHELIHYHPVFLGYLESLSYSLMGAILYSDKRMESQIEKLAQETYNSRPDIVERVRKAIEEAKKLEK
mgnify:CR=1 FL=1